GSRVRCSDDGVLGRIVWANAVSVKIRWDDGEQVTWRRDALAGKPIEIFDADTVLAESVPTETPAADSSPEQGGAEPAAPREGTASVTPEPANATVVPVIEPTAASRDTDVPPATIPAGDRTPALADQAAHLEDRQPDAPAVEAALVSTPTTE